MCLMQDVLEAIFLFVFQCIFYATGYPFARYVLRCKQQSLDNNADALCWLGGAMWVVFGLLVWLVVWLVP